MFVYAYRIDDRYRRTVVSLAVLADEAPRWRPRRFQVGHWGSRIGIRFLDWLMRLPEDLELQYTDAIFRIEEQLKMPYLSFVERRGEQIGEARGAARLLRSQLEQRVAPLPAEVIKRLEQADAEQLMRWGTRIADARSLDEVFGNGDASPAAAPRQPPH